MKVVSKLQQVAEPKGWTMSKLQRKADLGYGTVYRFWMGETMPDLLTLAKLAYVLKVPLTDLFDLKPEVDEGDDLAVIQLILGQSQDHARTPELVAH